MTIRLDQLDIQSPDADYDAVLDFYRLLGIEVHDGPAEAIRHADAEVGGITFHLDNHHLATTFNAGARRTQPTGVLIGFRVDSREEVDALHARLVVDGYESRQVPFDAFWGARYAVIADPDGNDVGIMSPSDDTMRSWPPTPSPNS